MLPTLSHLSVNTSPVSRLRHWCSSEYLRISPLHSEFHSPLLDSSDAVLKAVPELSPGLSPLTYKAPTRALRPVIPNNASSLRITAAAGTELAELILPVLSLSSRVKELYNPKAFITHAALLDQAFAHCPIFPTAASRRSLGRVSVPVWLIILSDQLRIVALVSFYLTNKLILRGLIPGR